MIEQTAWAGAVPLVLLGLTLRPGRLSSLERQWVIVGLVFFVWALGPFLTVAGKDTALILPHAVLRYLPILSNARIPGRAFIVVQLAVAMLCAFAVVRLKLTRATIVALAAMILLDSLTMPFQLDLVPTGGAVEQALKSPTSPPGAVLELPIGVADGFGELGQFDFRSLAWQVRHGRPLVGGFVARVPDRVKTAYLTNPVLQRLLELSAQTSTPPDTTPEPVEMSPHLTTLGIRFVVINRDKAPAALVTFAFARLNLRPVTKDGPRELYAIQD